MRHLISNLFIQSCDGWGLKVMGIVSFYGAPGRPPAPQSKPPMLVADLINECILDDERLAVQFTHAAAGLHEPRGTAGARVRHPPARHNTDRGGDRPE
jgi:hypothetical protein